MHSSSNADVYNRGLNTSPPLKKTTTKSNTVTIVVEPAHSGITAEAVCIILLDFIRIQNSRHHRRIATRNALCRWQQDVYYTDQLNRSRVYHTPPPCSQKKKKNHPRSHASLTTDLRTETFWGVAYNSYGGPGRASFTWLVSWCFEPSQPQRITPGLNITSLYLQVIYCTSLYTTSNMVFWAHLCSADTRQGNLHPARWSFLFCGPTQEPVLAAANTGTTLGRFCKKCRWMDRKGRNQQGRNPWQ